MKWVKCCHLCQTPHLRQRTKNNISSRKMYSNSEENLRRQRGFPIRKAVEFILFFETKQVCSWMNRDNFNTQSNGEHSTKNRRYFECINVLVVKLIKEDGCFPIFLLQMSKWIFLLTIYCTSFIVDSYFTAPFSVNVNIMNSWDENEPKTIVIFGHDFSLFDSCGLHSRHWVIA